MQAMSSIVSCISIKDSEGPFNMPHSPAKAERIERHEARIRGAGTKPMPSAFAISFSAFTRRSQEVKPGNIDLQVNKKKRKTIQIEDEATIIPPQDAPPAGTRHEAKTKRRKQSKQQTLDEKLGAAPPVERHLRIAEPRVNKAESKATVPQTLAVEQTTSLHVNDTSRIEHLDSDQLSKGIQEARPLRPASRRRSRPSQNGRTQRPTTDLTPVPVVAMDSIETQQMHIADPRSQRRKKSLKTATMITLAERSDFEMHDEVNVDHSLPTIVEPTKTHATSPKRPRQVQRKRKATSTNARQALTERNMNIPSPKKPRAGQKDISSKEDDDIDWIFDTIAPKQKSRSAKKVVKPGKDVLARPSRRNPVVDEMDLDDLLTNIAQFSKKL